MTIEAVLGQYVGAPNAWNWNAVVQQLSAAAPTPTEQHALSHSVFQALEFGFESLLGVNQVSSPQVAMVVVKASFRFWVS